MQAALQRRWSRRDPSPLERAAADSGSAVEPAVARKVEAATNTDLGGVRVHTGAPAADAARSLEARAYTVGQDIHFAPGHYQPGTRDGENLLAHELVHTIQQRGAPAAPQTKLEVSRPGDPSEKEADTVAERITAGDGAAEVRERAPAQIARATTVSDGWNEAYLDRTVNGESLEKFESEIGHGAFPELEGSSAKTDSLGRRGTPAAPFEMTVDDLRRIGGDKIQKAFDRNPEDGQELFEQAIAKMKEGFEIMKLDTVEAQAQFIAHASWETAFARLTEGQTQDFDDNPNNQTMDWKDPGGVRRYQPKPEINPIGELGTPVELTEPDGTKKPKKPIPDGSQEGNDAGGSFIGRGPLQITGRNEYVKVLAYLQHRLNQGDLSPEHSTLLEEAIAEIKEDPSKAGDSRYAYLFSMASMQATGLDTEQHFSEKGMAGGVTDPVLNQEKEKTHTFEEAKKFLLEKAQALNQPPPEGEGCA